MSRPIADIQADLSAFYALRSKAATSGIAEYTEDSGQGSTRVRYITLGEIRQTIRDLEAELLEAQTDGGPTFATFDRGAC